MTNRESSGDAQTTRRNEYDGVIPTEVKDAAFVALVREWTGGAVHEVMFLSPRL